MTLLSKPTIDDIEAHGYKVLTKSEYEEFVRLYEAVKNWRYGLMRLDALERLYRSELQDEHDMPHFQRTVDPVWMILKELEAMER